MYVFLDFRVVIIKKGEIVEASFMMMNQVDSRCFDDNKRWWQKAQENDFKIESTIQESREVWFQDSRKDEFKFQENKSRRIHKGSIEKIFQKNKHSTVLFFKRVFSKFSKLPEFLLSGNRLPVAKFDFKSFQLNLQCSN